MANETLVITDEMRAISKELAARYRERLLADGSKAWGRLISFTDEVVIDGQVISIIFNMPVSDSGFPYWRVVESGRNPGTPPPIKVIKDWIEVKGIVPTPNANGKVPTTNQLAYLISRSIGIKGIAGKHALKNTIDLSDDLFSQFMDAVQSAIAEKVGNFLESIINVKFNTIQL